MSEHSLLPWRYRPLEHDDWGMIRGLDGSVVAVARSGSGSTESDLQRHRRNKTDPCGPNAELIVKAVNNHDALVSALTELYAQVCGECPSLLNEDSGGDSRLGLAIQDILASVGGAKE